MPELPEVETIVRELKLKVLGRAFVDVWTDFSKIIRKPKYFKQFKKEIKGRKIESIRRRGKNILIGLSENKTLLIHQKLTGHILLGKWRMTNGIWRSEEKGALEESVNKFIHLIFRLDNGQMLALSDLRKFAKAELWDREELENSEELKSLGPEPLNSDFTFQKFKEILKNKKGRIKQVLMDQTVIAGIGNIYSDEILWMAKVHPLKNVSKLNDFDFKNIYRAIKEILSLAIKLKGESISDYRRTSGEKGYYDKVRKIYRREGEICFRCGTVIKRVKIGGRSAHYCPKCQPY